MTSCVFVAFFFNDAGINSGCTVSWLDGDEQWIEEDVEGISQSTRHQSLSPWWEPQISHGKGSLARPNSRWDNIEMYIIEVSREYGINSTSDSGKVQWQAFMYTAINLMITRTTIKYSKGLCIAELNCKRTFSDYIRHRCSLFAPCSDILWYLVQHHLLSMSTWDRWKLHSSKSYFLSRHFSYQTTVIKSTKSY
jgi:hypothetical protein